MSKWWSGLQSILLWAHHKYIDAPVSPIRISLHLSWSRLPLVDCRLVATISWGACFQWCCWIWSNYMKFVSTFDHSALNFCLAGLIVVWTSSIFGWCLNDLFVFLLKKKLEFITLRMFGNFFWILPTTSHFVSLWTTQIAHCTTTSIKLLFGSPFLPLLWHSSWTWPILLHLKHFFSLFVVASIISLFLFYCVVPSWLQVSFQTCPFLFI